jgi:hypothetical protein
LSKINIQNEIGLLRLVPIQVPCGSALWRSLGQG